jgi:tetratricopeptide (TPR) repeat protein
MILFYIPLGMFFLVVLTRPFIVLCHELGHAVPALLLTSEPVTVYIGSYGDPRNSHCLRLGRLTFWFRYSLFWKSGLCVASPQMSQWRTILFILGGPVASSLLALVGTYAVFAFDLHGALKLCAAAFSLMAFVDLVSNLIPIASPTQLYDGRLLYSDGYCLKLLWYYRYRFTTEYVQAVEQYTQQQFHVAAALFERFLRRNLRSEEIYRYAISARLLGKEYEKALTLHDAFANAFPLLPDDYATGGLLKARLSREQESLADFEACLALQPDHLSALQNKGYTLHLVGQYTEARHIFDQVLARDPTLAYAYTHRGLARLKLGQQKEGLADLYHALHLDPQNAYAYRNLGIYQLEQDQVAEANRLFAQASDLDEDTHLLPELRAYTVQLLDAQ